MKPGIKMLANTLVNQKNGIEVGFDILALYEDVLPEDTLDEVCALLERAFISLDEAIGFVAAKIEKED